MTREEMKILRELKKAVEKDFLKPVSKRHGYKIISGIPYQVRGEWLYTIFISTLLNEIRIVIDVKPIALDNVFWEVFEMKEEAEKHPFSFHVNAFFVPYSFWLEEWRKPIATAEQAEAVLELAFTEADEKIAAYCEEIKSISDFKKLVQNHEPVNHLNCMLCDIVMGDYRSAMAKAEEELASHHHGGFASVKGGDIYEYVQRYCAKRL